MYQKTPSSVLFMPVRFGRASEEIALQVEAAIMDGRLKPGERLPSEREMQGQFGKGRGVIREAIKTLVEKGLLEVRKGAKGGAYVRELDVGKASESLALFLKQHPVNPEHLIEFREGIDRTITQLAVARGRQEDKDELHAEARRLEALLSEEEPDFAVTGELDRKLNLMLARMTGNPLLEWIMRALQMGFGSSDHALYEDPVFRNQAAANWSDTAGAIAQGELMRALAFIGHHYVLLRQCVESRDRAAAEQEIPFLSDTGDSA